jgi:cellulose synthase/poly-beta-1,6-N-acetylglucosamine synthase-like glycosyltransferase
MDAMTTVGFVLVALVAYTYVGYPLLVGLFARFLARPIRASRDYEPTVSACLAVSNGATFLAAKLDSLLALDYPQDKFEILVCSDGSGDQSASIVRQYAERDPRIRLLEHPTRLGKPSAVNHLAAAATGEVLLMTDVRQPLSPNALRALVAPLADESVGCVSGNLVLSGWSGPGVYWRYERYIRDAEGQLGRMVGVTGALYAVRRSDLPELPEDVILDDMFVPLSVALRGKKVVFSGTALAFDEAFEDDREFGRKVRTLAGNYQLVSKLPMLLVPGLNRSWIEIVSHKLMRLVCPWALVALFLISAKLALLPSAGCSPLEVGFWRALALAQLVFYALAATGAATGRLGSVARTFVVLNAAAVVGLWRFIRGRQAVTW